MRKPLLPVFLLVCSISFAQVATSPITSTANNIVVFKNVSGSTSDSGVSISQVGVVTGGSCGSNQFTTSISTAGVPTCAAPFTLTTTGSSGAATFSTGTLNIPQYSGGFSNPMTTLGDVIYGGASGVATRLAGPTTTAHTYVLSDIPVSSAAVAPVWTDLATVTSMAGLQTVGTAGASAWGISKPGGAGQTLTIASDTTGNISLTTGGATINFGRFGDITGLASISAPVIYTPSNCSSAASPAVCGSAAAGNFVIAVAATSVVVNTTNVGANSQILLTPDESLSTKLGVTCNTTAATALAGAGVTTRVAGTSFTVSTLATIATNPVCFSYRIVNF